MKTTTPLTLAAALLLGTGLAAAQDAEPAAAPALRAQAHVMPTEGNTASGTVVFEQTAEGVRVTATLTGLAPGEHGFHVHQWGDCSAPDGTSAGGHFNPGGVDHAGPHTMPRHVGDLGNITADESGNAAYEAVNDLLTFDGPNNILGRGLIVHADADDLTSQPTGAAGGRIGCAVIGAVAPASAEE